MEAPPKKIDTQIRRIAKTHDGRTVVRGNRPLPSSPLTAESMPVLSAFNEFLDNERKQARRRMIALSLFFIIILLGTSAALFYIGFGLFRQTQADIADLQTDLREYRHTLSEVSTENIRGMIERRNTAVQGELLSAIENTRRQAIEDSRSVIEQELSRREQEISRLRKMLDELDMESSSRRREVAAIRTEWQAVMDRLRTTQQEDLPRLPTATTPSIQRTTRRGQIKVPLEVDGRQISFLLPIPE